MTDDDPRDRFQNIREEYDDPDREEDESSETAEGQESNDGQDGGASNEVDATSSGGLKASRKSVQAYVPPAEKENLEDSWRRIKALCNLAGEDEPPKNDFYTAALREGYTNFAAMAAHLGLAESYHEFGDVIN